MTKDNLFYNFLKESYILVVFDINPLCLSSVLSTSQRTHIDVSYSIGGEKTIENRQIK